MMKFIKPLFIVAFAFGVCCGQNDPAKVPIKEMTKPAEDTAERTFESTAHRFKITFPPLWTIAGEGFESEMSEHGVDLSLTPPGELNSVSKAQLNKYLDRVTVLATAYRSVPGAGSGAVARISAEDLKPVPAVRDAVDYFDLMRSQFAAMKVPSGFKYSETQAEKLGDRQYAFIDVTSESGKKRLYATVRARYAIIFAVSYTNDADLAAFREALSGADFTLK